MSVTQDLINAGPSSVLVDPTAAQRQSLSELANHPALGGADTGLTSFLSTVQTHMSSTLADMPTKLPMMGAADRTQTRLNTCDGTYPQQGGTPMFNNAFADVQQAPSLLGDLGTKLQALFSNAPPPPSPLPDGTMPPNPTVDAAQALVASHQTQFTDLASMASAAYEGAQSMLHNFAFTSFLSMPQSPALQGILSKIAVVPPQLAAERELMQSTGQTVASQKGPPMSLPRDETIAYAPPAANPKPMNASTKDALMGEVNAAKREFDSAESELKVASTACQNWQAANNYAEVKRLWKESDDPQANTNWQNLKARYNAEAYNNFQDKYVIYTAARDRYQKARSDFSSAMG